jgi:hypothetical protein
LHDPAPIHHAALAATISPALQASFALPVMTAAPLLAKVVVAAAALGRNGRSIRLGKSRGLSVRFLAGSMSGGKEILDGSFQVL